MKKGALRDEDIRRIVHAYIQHEGNKVHTHEATGYSYHSVDKYSRLWEEGKLGIEGIPAPIDFKPPREVGESGRVRKVMGENVALRKERDALQAEVEELRRVASLVGLVDGVKRDVPDWVVKKPSKGQRGVIATAFLSDVHLDEVIHPEQVNWVNAYNREIAGQRLRLFFENTIELARDYLSGFRYEGLVMPLGGDIFAGIIHEELVESNEGTIFESMLYWADPVCAGIKLVRDAFGRVFLPCVVGNHGRRQRKPHAKNRAQDNFEYLFYHLLKKLLSGENGIEFVISEAADQPFRVYDTKYLLTHGDQFKGGSGIAGLWSPLMLGDARKRARENAVQRPYDHMIMGHWHQLKFFGNIIVNGCFTKNQKVVTSTGLRDIIDIQKGDSVMSKDGSKQTVTNTFQRTASRVIGLKVHGLPEVLEATPNHLVWASKRASGMKDVTPVRRHRMGEAYGPAQWIPMDFLSPGDYVHVPFPKGNERPVDLETAWAYGLYLAEGNALLEGGASKRHHRVNLTMHLDEIAIVERWAAWFEKHFGRKPRICPRPKKTTTDLVVSVPREVSQWFRDTFGHRAANKHLPEGALFWADDLKAALVEGWVLGDGHRHPNKDMRETITASTISPQLAWGMFHLAVTTGRVPSLSKLSKGGPRKSDSYLIQFNSGQHAIQIDGEWYFQIKERYENHGEVDVYDLEVSGEHTYAVNGVGVHNSVSGLDEYAFLNNFGYEPPRQAFWVTDSTHGVTITAPIHVAAKDEVYSAATGSQAMVGIGWGDEGKRGPRS